MLDRAFELIVALLAQLESLLHASDASFRYLSHSRGFGQIGLGHVGSILRLPFVTVQLLAYCGHLLIKNQNSMVHQAELFSLTLLLLLLLLRRQPGQVQQMLVPLVVIVIEINVKLLQRHLCRLDLGPKGLDGRSSLVEFGP